MINIAEILKDCPKGTKLYSPIFGDGELFKITDNINVKFNKEHNKHNNKLFDNYGRYCKNGECLLYPSKDQRDWSKFQIPFKDGDIISDGFGCICIYKSESWLKDTIDYYCGILSFGDFIIKSEQRAGSHFGCIKCYHLASEEERQKLLSAIKDNGYKWNPENKTLEKLVEPKFKVGDKVVYTKFGDNCDDYPVTIESMEWTGTTIEYTFDGCVTCLAKDLKIYKEETMEEININRIGFDGDKARLVLPVEYEFKAEGNEVFIIKKKPKYPKTYEECCKIKQSDPDFYIDTHLYSNKLGLLYKLLICRGAYWKIAGEQMGLDKPWEPDWTTFEGMPAIFRFRYNIVCEFIKDYHCLLVFPTEEMRDAFYDNFKDMIEQCKELL